MSLQAKDFKSKQEVRWCPGCGNYGILAAMQKFLPQLGIPKEKIVFVSGIGCSGRFPYYMNTYGFHTIHGRAPAIATGLKVTRPDLSVWVVIGDGDGLSIGLTHLLHALRRNVDINILLINNRIYGLTKGQFSPASDPGTITPTSPQGKCEEALNPIKLALAAGATFIARGIDTDLKRLEQIFAEAALHKGSSFIEILQDCHVFNPKAFAFITDKPSRDKNTVWVENGKPLLFGEQQEKLLSLNNFQIDIKNVHDKQDFILEKYDANNELYAYLLSQLAYPTHPLPIGVLRKVSKLVFGETKMQCHEKKAIQDAIDTLLKKHLFQ